MRNKCKDIFLGIILLLSSVDCWVMFTWRKEELINCAAIGAVMGILLWMLHVKSHRCVSIIIRFIGFIIGLLFCYNLTFLFYQNWLDSKIIEMAANMLSLNFGIFLKILSYVLALIAFPSVVYFIIIIIQYFVASWKNIDTQKVREMLITSFSVKNMLGIIANVGGASVFGTLLLIGVYCLPVASIQNNVNSSAEVFEAEGTYPSLFTWCTSQLDNFTDAIMLLEAADGTSDSAINRAILAYRGTISEIRPSEALVEHYINGVEYDEITTYPRYWHGYQVLLKPLLEFMDYQTIRVLNAIVQLLLVLLVSGLLTWRKMKGYVIPYLLSYLMLMPVALAKSLMFSTCYYIFTFAMIALLLLGGKVKDRYVYITILYIGIAAAFFDLSSYPIATLGIPALLYLFMHSDYALERRLSSLLKLLFCWGVGYAGMWSLKWVIASLLTENNVILDAFNKVLERTSHTGPGNMPYTVLECEIRNMVTFFSTPFMFLVVMFTILLLRRLWEKII